MKSLNDRRSQENGRLIDGRPSRQGNRFATDDGAATKETAGLINNPQGEHRRPFLKSIGEFRGRHTELRVCDFPGLLPFE